MSVGLSGAHGTGKSTLAREFARVAEWQFIPSPGSECFRELGLPFVGLDFEQRMAVQRLILKRMDERLRAATGTMWISDRTPYDMLAYTQAEWAQRCTEAQGRELMAYGEECFRVLNRHYSLVVLISPGIAFVDDGTRPAPNVAFQEVHTNLCRALMMNPRVFPASFAMAASVTDLAERALYLTSTWNEIVRRLTEAAQLEDAH